MKSLPFFLLSFVCFVVLAANPPRERKLYVGSDSAETEMKFQASVRFESSSRPSEREALEKIGVQLTHLFGPMGEATQKAVPKGDHEIALGRIEKSGTDYVVHYTYSGTVVVQKVNGRLPPTYSIVLPVNPDNIYDESAVVERGRRTYPCTDDHYFSEGDFWYFWNPDKSGCELEEGTHFFRIAAKVKERPNTRASYPEYSRLVEGGEIHISVLMGMDEPTKGRDPYKSVDTNASNYRDITASLKQLGYQAGKPWTKAQVERVTGGALGGKLPYVEVFEKQLTKAKVTVRMFFGPSGINEESGYFHHFYKDALENSAVMIYDGHSGLGGHLNLASIEQVERFRIQFPKNRYQILFFNSCSSYSYYNTMYFGRKATDGDPRGSKNLDILTNGLATFFSVMHKTNLVMLEAVHRWAAGQGSVNYQTIARSIDSGNLFGVNGDEDNPTSPQD